MRRRNIETVSVEGLDADLAMAWHEPAPHSSGYRPHYNSGFRLIRATEWSRGFFARVWDLGPLPHRWND